MAILGKWEGKCCDTHVLNNNDMLIGTEVLKKLKETDDYKAGIENGWFIGYAGHPEDVNYQNFAEGCVVMRDMKINEQTGEVTGVFDLIDTPVGRTLKTFIDAGVKFGISIRAFGDVDYQGNVSPDDFVFRGFDIVTFPAYNDCIPEFKAIAASTDPKTKSKYKILATAIKDNIDKITMPQSLEVFQDQFNEKSDEYQLIQDKLDILEDTANDLEQDLEEYDKDSDNTEECDDFVVSINEELDFTNKKLEAMTELYLDTFRQCEELQNQVQQCQTEISDIQCSSDRKLKAMKRITASQHNDMIKQLESLESRNKVLATTNNKLKDNIHQKVVATTNLEAELKSQSMENKSLKRTIKADTSEIENLKSENARLIEANTKIKDKSHGNFDASNEYRQKLEEAERSNLIYKQKIEANTKLLAEKDTTISNLNSKLRETVSSYESKLSRNSSNRDAEISQLKQQINASEEIIAEYQQAYADMCAGAVGVHLRNIPITATTSVKELKDYIYSASSANNSTSMTPLEPLEFTSNVSDDGDLTTL